MRPPAFVSCCELSSVGLTDASASDVDPLGSPPSRCCCCCLVRPPSELLQNSDDAEAKSVQLHFFTAAGAAAADRLAAAASSSNTAAAPADGAAPSETGLVERPAASAPQPPPDLKTAEIERYVFKNDGLAFRPEDWARLKKIAEGNPDESKVGAFGVRPRVVACVLYLRPR